MRPMLSICTCGIHQFTPMHFCRFARTRKCLQQILSTRSAVHEGEGEGGGGGHLEEGSAQDIQQDLGCADQDIVLGKLGIPDPRGPCVHPQLPRDASHTQRGVGLQHPRLLHTSMRFGEAALFCDGRSMRLTMVWRTFKCRMVKIS